MHLTFGGSCGKFWLMAKLKWNSPPLYMPSSGSMVSMKFRMSSGLGNWVRMVLPRESSERSGWIDGESAGWFGGACRRSKDSGNHTLLHTQLGSCNFLLFLSSLSIRGRRLLLFLGIIISSNPRASTWGSLVTGRPQRLAYHRPYLQHPGVFFVQTGVFTRVNEAVGVRANAKILCLIQAWRLFRICEYIKQGHGHSLSSNRSHLYLYPGKCDNERLNNFQQSTITGNLPRDNCDSGHFVRLSTNVSTDGSKVYFLGKSQSQVDTFSQVLLGF